MGSNKVSPGIQAQKLIILWVSRVIIWFSIILVLFPMVWIVASSFSKGDNFFYGSVFPQEWGVDNYERLFKETDFLKWVFNSIKVCTFVALIQIVLTVTAAYAFSRMRFHGRKYGLMSLMILQIFPASMATAAIYYMIYKLNLVDNIAALILLLAGGSAYNIWLMKNYIDKLPRELDEAALVDGAGHFTIFRKITIPLSMPMIVVIFLFSFIGAYSEFIITAVVMRSPENLPLSVGLQTFINGNFATRWTLFSAAALLSSIPVMIIFMLLQKYIQSGLAAGAVKG